MIKIASITLINNVISQGLTLVSAIYAASMIGASNFGSISVLIATISVLSLLTTLQVERYYIITPKLYLPFYFTSHLIQVIIISLILALIIHFSYISASFHNTFLLLVTCSFFQCYQYLLIASGEFSILNKSKIIQALVASTFNIIAGFTGESEFLFVSYYLSWLLASYPAITYLRKCSRYHFHIKLLVRLIRNAKKVVGYSLPAMLAVSAIRDSPVILASYLFGSTSAGTAAMSQRLMVQPLGLIAKSFTPIITNTISNQSAKLSKKTYNKLFLFCFIGVFAYIIICLIIFLYDNMVNHNYPNLLSYSMLYGFYSLTHFVLGMLGGVIIIINYQRNELLLYITQCVGLLILLVTSLFIKYSFISFYALTFTVLTLISAPTIISIFDKLKQRTL